MRTSMQCFFILLILVHCSLLLHAQNSSIDSLKKVLLSQKEDTNKVNTLSELSRQLLFHEGDTSAMQKANEALSISEKINFTNGKGKAHFNIGQIYEFRNKNFPEARKNYYTAIKYFNESNDKNNMASAYLSIMSTYNGEGNIPLALENIYKALKLFEETGNKEGLAGSYLALSSNNELQKDYHEALKYSFLSLKMYDSINNKVGGAYANEQLGKIYFELENYKEALKRDSLALEIYYKEQDKALSAFVLKNIGNIYEKQGIAAYAAGDKNEAKNRFDESLNKYLRAIKLLEEAGIPSAYFYTDIGKLFIRSGDLAKAKFYLEKSLNFYKENKDNESLAQVFIGLAELDSANRNFAQAYEHYSCISPIGIAPSKRKALKSRSKLKCSMSLIKKRLPQK